ncbi:MAG TPA: SIS domain-containing protein, partial [Bryobacteraceae bacterium]|nr:SIS domain-containing protein [Bryobacteraceae bacterium]
MIAVGYEKLQGAYLRDILDQPRALQQTIAGLERMPALEALVADLRGGRRRRIVLTGMGGSYHILHPLHLRLIARGFDCSLAETSELVWTMPALLAPENVVIAVSQSGESAEIVRLLAHSAPLFVGVTNTPGSTLATHAAITILTRAGQEAAVSCKTAITAMAALDWLGEHLAGGDLPAVRRELEQVVPAAANYLSGWREHVATLVGAL